MQKQLPGLTDRGLLLAQIRNHYWHIRHLRPFQGAKRRALYRAVAKIKAVLLSDGFDAELLRLYCRQFASLDEAAQGRYVAYAQQFDAETKKTRFA